MKLYDVTVPLRPGMVVWPKDPAASISLARSLAHGDASNVTQLDMSAHTGTHIDAPCHFLPNTPGVDSVSLETLIGPCRVFDLTDISGHIDRAALERCDLDGVTRALFKTRNSERWARHEIVFDPGFVGLLADAAQYLIDHRIKLTGIDYLSIEPFGSKQHPVHCLLLNAGIVILETLDLSAVPAGDYELIALPLRLCGADGSPTRALLRKIHKIRT